MKVRQLRFPGSQGYELAAQLDLPDRTGAEPPVYALFAHCFTCNKNYKAVGNVSRSLTEEGIACLRFDFTGLGQSEGDFAETSFSSNVEDLVAAAEYLQANYSAPGILIGHSLGGAAVIQAAQRIPSSVAVATIAAPSNLDHVSRLFTHRLGELEREGAIEIRLAGRTFTITRQFVDDLEETHMQRIIADLRKPLLIFHSPTDSVVGIDNAAQIFAAARHPKSFISLDGADHLLADERDSSYVGAVVAAWAGRYVRSQG